MAEAEINIEQIFANMMFYERLLRQGYRRYNSLAYRSCCRNCHECIPIRIPVETFSSSKSRRQTD